MDYVVEVIREMLEENENFWRELIPGLKEEEYVKLAYITVSYVLQKTFNF